MASDDGRDPPQPVLYSQLIAAQHDYKWNLPRNCLVGEDNCFPGRFGVDSVRGEGEKDCL